MATIVWGAWTANNRWRIGIETYYSPTSITASTSAVTVYTNIWFQVQYSSNESGQSGTTVKLTSPYAAGPTQFSWSLGANGTKKILSTSRSYNLNYGSTQKLTMSGSATVAYTYPGTGTASTTLTLPARPLSAPAAPTSPVLTRGSGESLSATWVNHSSSAAPYTNIEYQWYNSHGTAWYNGSSSLSGSTTSYSGNGGIDYKYKFRVRAKNSAGYSAWVESGWASTTPAVPAAPSAAKNSVGDIVVSYGAPASGSSAYQYEIWHKANGVADAAKLATVTAAAGSWTHANPDTTKTHSYFLKAVSTGPTLTTAASADSNTVQLQAPPNAPTSLSPNGPTLDAAKAFNLVWTHNPTDTTPQKFYEIQRREYGTTVWTSTGKVSSTTSLADPTGWFTSGKTWEWQVRTWGAATTGGSDGTGGSPWSSSAVFSLADAPQVAISSPDGSAPVGTSVLTVQWGYSQSNGAAQSSWTAKLYDANGVTLQALSGNGTDSSATFPSPVTDASSYTIGVQVTSTDGLTSDEALQPITVDFLEPPSGIVHPTYDAASGTTYLDIEVPGPQAADVTVRTNGSPNPSFRSVAGTAVVRTNRALNPSLSVNNTYWASAGGSTNTFTSTTKTDGDGPLLPNSQSVNYFRMTCTAAGAAGNQTSTGPIYGQTANDGAPVVASKAATISMYYRTSRARDVQLVTTFADGAGTLVGSAVPGPVVSVPANTWVRLASTVDVPAGATRSMTRAYPATSTTVDFQVGDTIDATAALVETDCRVALDYFDGDSPQLADESGWTCSWSGTAGASASNVSGEQVANGALHSYSTYSWYGAKVAGQDIYRELFLGGSQSSGSLIAWMDSPAGVKTVATGDYWSGRVQVRILPGGGAITFNPRIGIYDPTYITAISDQANDLLTVQPDGVWVDVEAVALTAAPSGLTSAATPRFMLYTAGGPTTPGTLVEYRRLLIEKVDAPGEHAGVFFDGSSAQDGDLRHRWVGAADASLSEEFIQQQVPATSVEVYRSTDLEDWRLVGKTDPGSSLSDPIPPLNETVYYRTHTISDLPSVAVGRDTSIFTETDRIMLVNAGPGFSQSVRIKHNLSSDETAGLVNRELHRFAGREKAVEYSGIEEERSISIKGTLYGVVPGDEWSEAAVALERAKSSSWEEIVAFSKLRAPMVLRTSWGVRCFVSPGKPSISGRGEVEQQVTWAFEETDDEEPSA